MQGHLLPLFPLKVVLFPRSPLPLHIFEERYKEMIGEAIETKSEFGVVLAMKEGIASVGCTATVEQVLKRYPDGRMDIMTVGRRRFELLQLNKEKTYLRGPVHFFDDDEPGPAPLDLRKRAMEAFGALQALGEPGRAQEPSLADAELSFQLADSVSDLDFRQSLLQTRSEAERLKALIEFLNDYVPKQRYIEYVKAVAPHNGRGQRPAELQEPE